MNAKGVKTALLLGTALTVHGPLYAAESESSTALEEIVVTARKQAENLQDVPISIQAFSGEAMERANIQNFGDMARRVPGLTLRVERALDAQIYMRGIGSEIQGAAADNAIGIYIDGVYMSRNTGVIVDLYDLERVEVLKGPQSLRFGKNVVGGLIHYVTKKPTDTLEMSAEGTIGSYNQTDFSAAVRGPINDKIFFGLTASSKAHAGYAKVTNGGDEEDQSGQSFRGQLRFKPNDSLDILLSADYTRRRDGARWVDVVDPGDSEAVTYNRFFAPPIAQLPGFVLPNRNAPFKNSDPRRGMRNLTGFEHADAWGLSGEVNWTASDTIQVTSLTAYRDSKLSSREDGCGMFWNFPIDPVTGTPDITSAMLAGLDTYLATVPDCYYENNKSDKVKQFSQELRLTWDNKDRWRWTMGAYYMNENIHRAEVTPFFFPDFDAITNFAFAMAFGGTPDIPHGGISNSLTSAKQNDYGLFGEISFKITEKLTLDAGARYVYDKKDFTAQRFGQSFDKPIPVGGFIGTDNKHWDALLPSLSLRYEPSNDAMLYLRYARGYKAGGWTGEEAGGPEDINAFNPEYADSYEAGSKFLFLDQRVRLNTAIYYTKYDDLQVQQFVQVDPTRPPDFVVVNAANGTEAYGLEADLEARVTEAVTLFGNYAYTHCKYVGDLILDAQGTNAKGNKCLRTPEHAFNVGADLFTPLTDKLNLRVASNLQWTGSYFLDIENSANQKIEDAFVWNARIAVSTADDKWEISGWIKNTTNELTPIGYLDLFGTLYGTYAPPRTYGLTIKWRH